MTLNDLELSQKRVISKFFAIFRCSAHFDTELRRNGWRYLDQGNHHKKFIALNVDSSNPSLNPLGSRRPAQAGVKYSYSPKKWLFYRNYLV